MEIVLYFIFWYGDVTSWRITHYDCREERDSITENQFE